jgi:hypothetical protein
VQVWEGLAARKALGNDRVEVLAVPLFAYDVERLIGLSCGPSEAQAVADALYADEERAVSSMRQGRPDLPRMVNSRDSVTGGELGERCHGDSADWPRDRARLDVLVTAVEGPPLAFLTKYGFGPGRHNSAASTRPATAKGPN